MADEHEVRIVVGQIIEHDQRRKKRHRPNEQDFGESLSQGCFLVDIL
jgi:hypothetical protein